MRDLSRCFFCRKAPTLPADNYGVFNILIENQPVLVCGLCISEFVLRAFNERKTAAHEFEGVLQGIADRDCTFCGLPDRDPIHRRAIGPGVGRRRLKP